MESCLGCLTIVLNILPFAHYQLSARDPYTINVLMLVSAIVTTLSSCVLICAREKRRATIIYVCTQTVELTLYTIILVSIMCDYGMRIVIGISDLLLLCMHFTMFIYTKALLIIVTSVSLCYRFTYSPANVHTITDPSKFRDTKHSALILELLNTFKIRVR
jgi:hypothetical protein